MTSALAANFAYLYTLPLCTFFSSLYYNVVIQSTSLQHCNIIVINLKPEKKPFKELIKNTYKENKLTRDILAVLYKWEGRKAYY